ncbi:hypothetical protein F5888DRAFT_532131 [Russula emetica]|nr:hypothetical protein F5888DRAFT_532131 [Russula emetica]
MVSLPRYQRPEDRCEVLGPGRVYKASFIMPFTQRFSETLFRASLYLLVIVIPFTTMAIPVITQEFSRSSTPATATDTDTVSSKLTNKQIFDIVFALVLFLLIFGCLALDAVLSFRLRARFGRAADAVVGSDGARAAPQTHDDDTSPTTVPASSLRFPTQNVELGALPSTPRCASLASDDSDLTSPSSA